MSRITESDLERWATRFGSSSDLAILVRRLLLASVPDPERLRFPSEKGVYRAGWDGFCFSDYPQSRFIPHGASVWELSTRADVPDKAREDFVRGLTKALPPGFVPGETTYVAVSLQKWPSKSEREDFLIFANGHGYWRDVVILDAQDLESWIEEHYAIEAWLCRDIMQIPFQGAEHIEQAWFKWSSLSKPPLQPALLLADRDEEHKHLISRLLTQKQITIIKADSPDEAQAFVISSILSLSEDDPSREYLLSRSLVVRDAVTLEYIMASKKDKLLILRDAAVGLEGAAERRGHSSIVPVGIAAFNNPSVELSRQSRAAFSRSLESMGIEQPDAERMSRECGHSVTVFLRRFCSGTMNPLPKWSQPPLVKTLVPAVLVGRWDESLPGDTSILEALSGQSYADYRRELQPLLNSDDPPIRNVGNVLALSAPADSFFLTSRSITPQDLSICSESIKEIFGEPDPLEGLPAPERPYAKLKGITRRFSGWIRDGMAETILLMSVFGDQLQTPGNIGARSYVENLLAELPGLKDDPRLLTSLGRQLPYLMEAAPVPFLGALENLLQGNPESLRILFTDSRAEDSFWGSSPHTNLLWGLEVLAWNPDFLPRVGLILAGLAVVDPGGRLANRPIASLREILLPWSPSTNASSSAREHVLELICARYQDLGWRLASSLLPSFHMVSVSTSGPKWHDFGRSEKETLTTNIVSLQYHWLLRKVVVLADRQPERWKIVLESLHQYPTELRSEVVSGLRRTLSSTTDLQSKRSFWEMIRQFVGTQLSFESAQWTLKREALDELASIAAELAPDDPIEQYKQLFTEHYPNLNMSKKDLNDYRRELASRREHALKKIVDTRGPEGVLALIEEALIPATLAEPWVALAETPKDVEETLRILSSRGVATYPLVSSISAFACQRFGDAWIDHSQHTLENLPKEVAVYCALAWPDDSKTFAFVTSLGEEADTLYWNTRPAWTQSKDEQLILFIIEHLFKVGRDLAALHLAGLHDDVTLPSQILFDLLDRLPLALAKLKDQQIDTMTTYYIEEVFKALRKRPDVDPMEIGRREYALLPLLDMPGNEKDLVLHKVLSKDPQLFVGVICDVYKASSGESDASVDDQKRIRAEYGYRLLESWKIVPGSSPDGSIREEDLRAWIHEVRRMAAEKDRANIAEQEIGRMLAYAPNDPEDHAWPHRAVRTVLEESQCKHIKIGIEVEQHNKRGAYWKALYEGGKQERAFAEQWRTWAKIVAPQWPFTGGILYSIAEEWERCATHEDLRAEQDRINDEQ